MSREFWNPEIEKKSLKEMKDLQLKRLKNIIAYVYKNNRFYRDRLKVAKLDSDRENNRLWTPQSVIPGGPSVQTYGRQNVTENKATHSDLSRIAPDILNALKENPYAFSVNSYA